MQCATAKSRNSAKQDLPENRETVDRYIKQMVLNAKEKLVAFYRFLKWRLGLKNIIFEGKSIKINVTCHHLEILEGLWDDYRSGHLKAKAEEYLITEEVKEELGMEKITLKTTILEEDYSACKSFLMKISG